MVVNDMTNVLLLDHAAGSLPEPLALAVSTHIAINAEARAKYSALNEVGGLIIEELEPVDVSEGALDTLFSLLDAENSGSPDASQRDINKCSLPVYDAETQALVPAPLRSYLPSSLGNLKWRQRGRGVKEYSINVDQKGFNVSLFSIQPGRSVPTHTHGGREYTVVLDGAYQDDNILVHAGDLVCNDASDIHKPVADAKLGCLCLAVTDAPIRLKGPLGWFVNPFIKH